MGEAAARVRPRVGGARRARAGRRARLPPRLGSPRNSVIEAAARPRGPYSLRLSCRIAGDATRTFSEGVLTAALEGGRGPELVAARQLPDGTVHLAGATAEGVERLRACLALDDDHQRVPAPLPRRRAARPLACARCAGCARPRSARSPRRCSVRCAASSSRRAGRGPSSVPWCTQPPRRSAARGCTSRRTAVISAASPRRSCVASACTPAAVRCSPACAARSSSSGCASCRPTPSRRGSAASGASAPGRSASSRSRASAASTLAWSATSG